MDDAFKDIMGDLEHEAPGVLARFPVLFAYCYGSYAAGVAHRFSDLDIGIFLAADARTNTLVLELQVALALDAALKHRVQTDVRAIHTLPLNLLGRMLTEGRLIYSRAENQRVDFEVCTRMAYFDFLPAIRMHHSTYIEASKAG